MRPVLSEAYLATRATPVRGTRNEQPPVSRDVDHARRRHVEQQNQDRGRDLSHSDPCLSPRSNRVNTHKHSVNRMAKGSESPMGTSPTRPASIVMPPWTQLDSRFRPCSGTRQNHVQPPNRTKPFPGGETDVQHAFNKWQRSYETGRVAPGHSVVAGIECWSEKPEVDGSTPSLTTRRIVNNCRSFSALRPLPDHPQIGSRTRIGRGFARESDAN